MTEQNQAELVSIIETGITTEASVAAGLGYPNARETESPSPTGWLNVSRETSVKND